MFTPPSPEKNHSDERVTKVKKPGFGSKLKVSGLLAVGALAGTLATMQLQATARNNVTPLPLEELQQRGHSLLQRSQVGLWSK